MKDALTGFAAAAHGMPVSHVWRGNGSALFVELGKLTPRIRRNGRPGEPEGEMGLMIEWSWRIEDQRSILCGSWSEEELWAPTFDKLLGQKVAKLMTFARLPEVMLSLSGDLHISSFMTAEGDPAWALFDRRGPAPVWLHCRSGKITTG